MSKTKIILIGAGGHAASCIDVIEQQNKYEIAGLIGLDNELNTKNLEYNTIGTDSDLPQLYSKYTNALITLGQIKSPKSRIALYKKAIELGFTLPAIVSPHAYISPHAKIGSGTIVMHGAIVNAGAVIGNNSIINNQSLVDHHTIIGDNCHISTGVCINGNVNIGSGSFIGSGSSIKEGIIIGSDCLIGMGLSVRYNIAESSAFIGNKNND
jgi:sugar O-acyltransferase (sialic acid O-acetyltransferase NeuD family)